jgi:hypothetical protein
MITDIRPHVQHIGFFGSQLESACFEESGAITKPMLRIQSCEP